MKEYLEKGGAFLHVIVGACSSIRCWSWARFSVPGRKLDASSLVQLNNLGAPSPTDKVKSRKHQTPGIERRRRRIAGLPLMQ